MSQLFLFKGKVQTGALLPAPGVLLASALAPGAVPGAAVTAGTAPSDRSPWTPPSSALSKSGTQLQKQTRLGFLCPLAGLPANAAVWDAAVQVCMFPLSSH